MVVSRRVISVRIAEKYKDIVGYCDKIASALNLNPELNVSKFLFSIKSYGIVALRVNYPIFQVQQLYNSLILNKHSILKK